MLFNKFVIKVKKSLEEDDEIAKSHKNLRGLKYKRRKTILPTTFKALQEKKDLESEDTLLVNKYKILVDQPNLS